MEIRLKLPLLVLSGLVPPIVLTAYFYVSYASSAWFFQDDFGFISSYATSVRWSELFDFTNFGRFVSRNAYWHYGIKFFAMNSELFFVFNLVIILGSCFLIFLTFKEHGYFNAFIAGLFYFVLPSTIESYVWLSNSQHLLGHFFVILFIYIYRTAANDPNDRMTFLRVFQLSAILTLGLASNIFVGLVLSFPIWMALTTQEYRRLKGNWAIIIYGGVLFSLFVANLYADQRGPYATSYDLQTFTKNIEYYFKNLLFGGMWIALLTVGIGYALLNKRYFTSWLFVASILFFAPFAFLVHQRYTQYGCLSHLFFVLGVWSILTEVSPKLTIDFSKYLGTIIIIILFSKSLDSPIRYFSENPRGADQKKQIAFLKNFDADRIEVKNYCFRSNEAVSNQTGVSVWDIPREWWFVGFGTAFKLFVNSNKSFELFESGKHCDVVFAFKKDQVFLVDP